MLTEYHCHILLGIDDGSDSVETSLQMVEMMKAQGGGAHSEERMTFLTENGINELFKMPLRGNKVKLNVTITKEHYDALMQKIGQGVSEYRGIPDKAGKIIVW